ncbi:hypothetical protein HNY73_011246 [Argiope bruennichi]|uniref:Uncharacterized protein n=1 Tax=Argiope bruennichi TaxID=94029 RepID=A0A8T0F3H3_ARGBR|nr:hypothetical protein HNY73_011246 [Argiope bruennichi]
MDIDKTESNDEATSSTTPFTASSIIPSGTLSPRNSSDSDTIISSGNESSASYISRKSVSSLEFEINPVHKATYRSRSNSGDDSAESEGERLKRRSPIIIRFSRTARKAKSRNINARPLKVPSERHRIQSDTNHVLPMNIDEENEANQNVSSLSPVFGLMRSFSTGDIDKNIITSSEKENLRSLVSEMALNSWKQYGMPHDRMQHTSLSSASLDDATTLSQLPSFQSFVNHTSEHPKIVTTDFVYAVHKEVRQISISRHLESIYKTSERLTRSELSLNLPSSIASVPTAIANETPGSFDNPFNHVPSNAPAVHTPPAQSHISTELDPSIGHELPSSNIEFSGDEESVNVFIDDSERSEGDPFPEDEKTMMIFNWMDGFDVDAFD